MLEEMIEYIKLHLTSLEQDSDELNEEMELRLDIDSDEYKDMQIKDISLNGQMFATNHLLSVANDILRKTNEG